MAAEYANGQKHILSTAAKLCAASLGTHCVLLDDAFLTIETFTGGDRRVGSLCEEIKAAPDGAARCSAARQAGAIRAIQLGGAYFYACHAELVEAIVPVQRDGAILGYVLVGPVLLKPADPLLTDKIAEKLSFFDISENTVERAVDLIPLVEPERLKQTVDLLGALLTASSTDSATAPQDDDTTEAQDEVSASVPARAGQRGLRRTVADGSVKERLVLARLRLDSSAEVRQDIHELVLHRAQRHPSVDVERAAALETVSALWRTVLEETDGSVRPHARDFGLEGLFKAQSVGAVLDWAVDAAKRVSMTLPPEVNSVLKDIQKYIRGSPGGKLSCAQVARAVGMDSRRLTRMMQRHLGISLKEYLIMERLTVARKLLRESNLTATEVAAQIGFGDQSNFTKVFQKYEGVTPIQYRKNWIQTERLLESRTG